MNRIYGIYLLLLLCNLLHAQLSEQQFERPETVYAPRVMWQWMNGNVTREGINLDLEAMAATGLGGGILFNNTVGVPAGPIKFGSPEWTGLTVHALQQADQLGLKWLLHSASEISGIGGPWITPENAMQQVVWSEAFVKGGETVNLQLPKPFAQQGFYKDIAVLAYPCLKGEEQSFRNLLQSVKVNGKPTDAGILRALNCINAELREGLVVTASKIIDLTNLLNPDGKLTWNAPKGNWTIVRIGHTVSAEEQAAASRSCVGLSVDKLSRYGVQQYGDKFLKPLFEQTRPYHGRSLVGLTIASLELGSQNWTRDMLTEFQKRAGYDLKPYLLTFTGRCVNSANQTERFLWDLRRVQSDMLVEYYYIGMRDILQKEGLTLSAEPFGDGAFESMQAVKRLSQFTEHPSILKADDDRMLTNGQNRQLFHVYEHQPHPTAQPGMVMDSFASHINRNNTWFSKAGEYFQYLRRCQYVLQRGSFVADAAYYLGEEVKHPIHFQNPNPGYAVDVLSRDALLLQASTLNTRLVLPDGRSYRFLVLPTNKSMSLPVLRKLRALLEDGLWVSANKPTTWPGLLSEKDQDEWQRIVEDLWNKLPDGVYRYGSGRLFINTPTSLLFKEENLPPDFSYVASNPNTVIHYQHRRMGSDEAWFVCNNRRQNDTILASFRIIGMQPEWWNPQTGEIRSLNIFRQHEEQTMIPLTLEPFESGFVVFRNPLKQMVYDGLMKDGVPLLSANPDDFTLATSPDLTSDFSSSFWANPEVITKKSRTSMFFPVNGPEFLSVNQYLFLRKKGNYSLLNPGFEDLKKPFILKKDLPVYDLSTDWIIQFPEGKGAPAHLKLDSLASLHTLNEFGVKYFSGTASWQRSFTLTPKDLIGNHLLLDLGQVAVMAEVYVNGKSAGTCWKPPFRLDITNLLKSGENQLDIRVTNLWVNRLIGDEFLPEENAYDATGELKTLPDWYTTNQPKTGQRVTFVTWKQYDQNAPLMESGLVGPVTLSVWKEFR